jgi:lysyl-tRNA synthetase class 2
MNIPSEAALARPAGTIPASPSVSNSMPAASSLPMPSASLPTPPSSVGGSRLEMAEKLRVYGETYPLDEDFLAALAIMPEASGIALGFDRLVMLATGAARASSRCMWAPVAEYGA